MTKPRRKKVKRKRLVPKTEVAKRLVARLRAGRQAVEKTVKRYNPRASIKTLKNPKASPRQRREAVESLEMVSRLLTEAPLRGVPMAKSTIQELRKTGVALDLLKVLDRPAKTQAEKDFRVTAVTAAGSIGGSRVVSSLVGNFNPLKSPEKQLYSAMALGYTNSPAAVRPLVSVVANPNMFGGARWAAAEALGLLAAKGAIDPTKLKVKVRAGKKTMEVDALQVLRSFEVEQSSYGNRTSEIRLAMTRINTLVEDKARRKRA